MSNAHVTREPAIDLARGTAMALMAVDHASALLNRGRVTPGSRNLAGGATTFATDQFFLRWLTHICPVAFIFLAGVSVWLMVHGRQARGIAARRVSRSLLVRGLLLIAIDFLWLNGLQGFHSWHLDVLTAIGSGFALLAFVHSISVVVQLVLAATLIATPEYGPALGLPQALANTAFAGGPASGTIFLNYPVLPWMGVMLLGVVWSSQRGRRELGAFALRTLAPWALLYVLLRGVNSWGNALAPRLDAGLQQWLNVSKNPPSVAFLALEFSFLGVLLWAYARAARASKSASLASALRVVELFGRTALFFYVIHFPLLFIAAMLTGTLHGLLMPGTLLGALLLLAAMYPLCHWYDRYKRSHDNVVTRHL